MDVCVTHHTTSAGLLAVYAPGRHPRGTRGRRDPLSLPNRGHLFDFFVPISRMADKAPHELAGQGHRE